MYRTTILFADLSLTKFFICSKLFLYVAAVKKIIFKKKLSCNFYFYLFFLNFKCRFSASRIFLVFHFYFQKTILIFVSFAKYFLIFFFHLFSPYRNSWTTWWLPWEAPNLISSVVSFPTNWNKQVRLRIILTWIRLDF